MKKITFILLLIFTSTKLFSQVSGSFGPSLIKPFGLKTSHPGIHAGFEINDDDFMTVYGRVIFAPGMKGDAQTTVVSAKDFDTNPYNLEINSYDKSSISMLEFGKRYYFGDGYESGFGIYGGSTVSIMFNSLRTEFDDFDKTKYMYTGSTETSGTILGMGFGVNGGIKNSFPFGTLFFDAGFNWSLFQISSNVYAQNIMNNPDKNRSFNFIFNLGFRKDFY